VAGYDTIYAVQLLADEREAAVNSSPPGLGAHLRAGVAAAYLLAVALLAAGLWRLAGPGFWVAGLAAMTAHLGWQIRNLDADDPAMALRLFKSNRKAGLLLTAGLVLDRLVA